MSGEKTPDGFVVLGYIARAHGVHGAMIVSSYAEDPESILGAERLELLSPEGERRLPVESLTGKEAAQGLIVKIKGVGSREAATALKGWRLGLERHCLPEAGDDEVYLADLLGLEVFSAQGQALGRVRRLMETGGAGLLLVVQGDEPLAKELLIPYNEEFLVSLDVAAGRVEFNLPPGLLDL